MTKHTIIFILSLIATVSSITGNIFINHKRKVGFIIWAVANVIWILVNCMGELNYPQICIFRGIKSGVKITIKEKKYDRSRKDSD